MNRLKELREETGLNRRELSEAVGLKYTTYLNYENELREMDSDLLIMFANYFGVSVDYLIGRTDDREKHTEGPDPEISEMLEEVRRRPELKFLLSLATKSRTSAVLESSALLQKYQEESEGK